MSRAEFDETHARWAAEHIARNPGTVFTPEYRALAARAVDSNKTDIPEFLL